VFHSSCTLRLRQGRVSQVALRTPTSIFLLSVLVAGVLSPSGLCALMCERRSHAEAQRHCSYAVDPMPGMKHHQLAGMKHPDIDAGIPLWTSRSCPSNCDAVERLNLSRKVTAQVKVIRPRIGVRDTTDSFLLSDLAAAWCSDEGPPTGCAAFAAAFNILRI
jgi:hypothetical protein